MTIIQIDGIRLYYEYLALQTHSIAFKFKIVSTKYVKRFFS